MAKSNLSVHNSLATLLDNIVSDVHSTEKAPEQAAKAIIQRVEELTFKSDYPHETARRFHVMALLLKEATQELLNYELFLEDLSKLMSNIDTLMVEICLVGPEVLSDGKLLSVRGSLRAMNNDVCLAIAQLNAKKGEEHDASF